MKTFRTKLALYAVVVAALLLIEPRGPALAAGELQDSDTAAGTLEALEDGLRETDAIGFSTKLSLKFRIESLIDRFHKFHAGEDSDGLDVLEAEFATLMDHTLALVRSDDPALYQQISIARQGLWMTLRDPIVFAATLEPEEATFLAMRNDR